MCKSINWEKIKATAGIIWQTFKGLCVWLFVSFLLPITQLLIMRYATKPFIIDEGIYNVFCVSIASFLTGVFFVTDFWKKNRSLVRVLLVVSYLLSFGLFTISLIQILFDIKVFETHIYQIGILVALLLAVLVGFYSKYDENLMVSQTIVNKANTTTQGIIDGKQIKL